MKILLATSNVGKLKEMEALLGKSSLKNIEFITLKNLPSVDEPDENGKTFFDNAYIKVMYYYNKFKIPTISDDSGLMVKALKNAPGVHTSRYAALPGEKPNTAKNIKKLLSEMEGVKDRKASFKTSMLFFDGKMLISSEGKMDGEIALEPVGNNGFGYDPIFYLPTLKKTVASLSEEEKNKISHRAKACKMLIEKLEMYF